MRTPLELLFNFHWVIEGRLARSAQGVSIAMARVLPRRGIRAVINLRGDQPRQRWWRSELALCERLGIAHYDAMLDSRRLPTRQMLGDLVDAFETAPEPVLVKCSGGQDRTSLAAAIFIVSKSGWGALPEALGQFARFPYLHFPKRGQGWLQQFPRYADLRAQGRPIAQWIREEYEPEAFATWLRDNSMGDSFKGIFSWPWKPHYRE